MAKLILHYDCMNESNFDLIANTIKDLSGNGNHGTLVNANLYDKNYGLYFNRGIIKCDRNITKARTSYTVQFKYTKVGENPGGTSIYLYSNRVNNGLFMYLNNYAANNTGGMQFYLWDWASSGNTYTVGTPSLPGLHTTKTHTFDTRFTIDASKEIGIIEEKSINFKQSGRFINTLNGDKASEIFSTFGPAYLASVKIYEGVVNLDDLHLLVDENNDIYQIDSNGNLVIVSSINDVDKNIFDSYGMDMTMISTNLAKWKKDKFKIITLQRG